MFKDSKATQIVKKKRGGAVGGGGRGLQKQKLILPNNHQVFRYLLCS